MAMILRTGKSGRYRYYTCSTKARQGAPRRNRLQGPYCPYGKARPAGC
jgi:hypothetical protein